MVSDDLTGHRALIPLLGSSSYTALQAAKSHCLCGKATSGKSGQWLTQGWQLKTRPKSLLNYSVNIQAQNGAHNLEPCNLCLKIYTSADQPRKPKSTGI